MSGVAGAAGDGTAARTRANGVVIVAVALALLAALWFFAGRERELRRSAVGFAGLVEWLDANGVEASTFTGGGWLVRGEVGLRILALHDTDPATARVAPETPDELIAQTSETDLALDVLRQKIELLPTLLILPKWRSGVRVLGAAHRDMLIPAGELDRLVAQIPQLAGTIRRDPEGYVETPAPDGPVGLFHAQTLSGSGCEPLLGTADALLLGRCALPGKAGSKARGDAAAARHFWVLADPDLMDNHGLTRAANADAALAFVRQAAGGGPVVLDLTDHVAAVDPDHAEDYRRSWEDLARLFRWPFGVVWVAFAALAGLVLWRALVRYGPVQGGQADEAMRASREVSIGAKARLLRLADHDAELMRLHFATRLQQLAAELLGPHAPPGAEPLALIAGLLGRRAPGLGAELEDAARLPATRGRAGDLLARLDRFENCIDRIRDEFGRVTGARG